MNLEEMLINLGLKFEGTQHCGLHDSRNIARITIQLLEDGCDLVKNEFLHVAPPSPGVRGADKTDLRDNEQSKIKSQEEVEHRLKELKLESQNFVEENQDLLEYHRLQSA
jgi:hypothetical protein